jgi:hypothetical protein
MTALSNMNNQGFSVVPGKGELVHFTRNPYGCKRGAKRNMSMLMSDQSTLGFLSRRGVVEVDCSSASS